MLIQTLANLMEASLYSHCISNVTTIAVAISNALLEKSLHSWCNLWLCNPEARRVCRALAVSCQREEAKWKIQMRLCAETFCMDNVKILIVWVQKMDPCEFQSRRLWLGWPSLCLQTLLLTKLFKLLKSGPPWKCKWMLRLTFFPLHSTTHNINCQVKQKVLGHEVI